MRVLLLLIAYADTLFSTTHSFKALPAPQGEPSTDERCMNVCYTDDAAAVDKWLDKYAAGAAALGFDTETAPSFAGRKKHAPGPHVLQIAVGDDVLVAHLVSGDVCSSSALSEVLGDPQCAKVGVGLDDDAVELFNLDARLGLRGRLDIGGPRKARRLSLREVAYRAIGGPIAPKAKKIATSNWANHLKDNQLAYAARDAWLGAAIYSALAADTAFTDAAAAQIDGEIRIPDLAAVAADRKLIKRRLKALDEDAEDYKVVEKQIRKELKKFPRPRPTARRLRRAGVRLTMCLNYYCASADTTSAFHQELSRAQLGARGSE